MKKIWKYIIIFIIVVMIYNFLLTIACSFNSEKIKENVEESSKILTEETNIKKVELFSHDVYLDNYTDALMVNICYSIDNNKPIESYLLARKNYIPDITKTVTPDPVGELKSARRKVH